MPPAYFRAYRAKRRAARGLPPWQPPRPRPGPLPDVPAPYTGHPIFDAARAIVGPPAYFEQDAWEERMGAVVVELLARGRRRAPRQALHDANTAMANHRRHTISLEAMDARQD